MKKKKPLAKKIPLPPEPEKILKKKEFLYNIEPDVSRHGPTIIRLVDLVKMIPIEKLALELEWGGYDGGYNISLVSYEEIENTNYKKEFKIWQEKCNEIQLQNNEAERKWQEEKMMELNKKREELEAELKKIQSAIKLNT